MVYLLIRNGNGNENEDNGIRFINLFTFKIRTVNKNKIWIFGNVEWESHSKGEMRIRVGSENEK